MFTSWKTTVAGIAAFVAVLAAAIKAQLDGDPSTVADWNGVVAAAIILVGLLSARDNSVSSETAGAK